MGGSPWGASEELWAAMANDALDANLETVISVYRWPRAPEKLLRLQEKGARIHWRARQTSRVLRLVQKYRSSFAPIFKEEPDVLLISQGGTYDATYFEDLLDYLTNSAVPYLVLCHANNEFIDQSTRQSAKQLFSRAFCVGFMSPHSRKFAERQLASSLPNAIVLQNPLTLPDLTSALWPTRGIVRMASVGRLDVAHKGQDILFEALSTPLWKSRDWKLSLYGEGPDRGYLESLAEYYGIADRVVFRGFVHDVKGIWEGNHLLVLPSRERETVPMVVVEAMVCGRPVVSTAVGISPDWLEEGRTGFMAEGPIVTAFGAALERAWRSQTQWEDMGAAAHETVLGRLEPSPSQRLLHLVAGAAKVPSSVSMGSR